jgi:hypothetical protein
MPSTPVYIICSPRPLVGRTLIARLLGEFLLLKNGDVTAFDINLKEPSLLEYLPRVTETAEVGDTFGKMALMDRVIVNDGIAKVIDLGFHAFDEFFKMSEEIGFMKAASRRSSCSSPTPTASRRAATTICSSRSPKPRSSPSTTSTWCAANCPRRWPMAASSASPRCRCF